MTHVEGPPCDSQPSFLFSIDLEDVRTMVPSGERLPERIPENIDRYLKFFDKHQIKVTFFTVGEVARRYPSMIRDLAAMGHEIACHSSDHMTLDQHTPDSFRVDLLRNIEDLDRAGGLEIRGYRAPMFSLTSNTIWVYEQLEKLGLTYSSSVLPAHHPHYGWPGFRPGPQWAKHGILELPITLLNIPGLRVPMAGGVYFRVLPFALIRSQCRKTFEAGKPVVGYLHPFDIDTGQERFMHPRLNGNRLHNWLMYFNRKNVFARLESLIELGVEIKTYREYVDTQFAYKQAVQAEAS